MREENYTKIVFPGLQAYRGYISDIFLGQHPLQLLVSRAGECGKWLRHFRYITKADKTAAPVSQFADVFSRSAFFQVGYEIRRKAALHRGKHGAPTFGHTNCRPPRR